MNSLSIENLLEKFLTERPRAHRPYESELFERWEEVVGAEAGRLARPLSLENGRLILVVSGFTTASEVSFSSEHYKESLNRFFGITAVKEVRIRVQEATPMPPVSALREKPSRYEVGETFNPDNIILTTDECAWADETASRVQDEATRKSLRHLLLLHLKREKWERGRVSKGGGQKADSGRNDYGDESIGTGSRR